MTIQVSTYEPQFKISQDYEWILDSEHATNRVEFRLHPSDPWTRDNQSGTLEETQARLVVLWSIFRLDSTER